MEFYEVDFRLRSFIAKDLEHITLQHPDTKSLVHHISPQKGALQLALCYRIGFGVTKSDDKVKKFLKGSQDEIKLGHELRAIKDSLPP